MLKLPQMRTKNRNPALLLEGKKVDPIIEFYFELNHLKQLFRQGWLLKGIPVDKCESVADHLFGTSILTLIIADNHFETLNTVKLLKMVLIHELGEIYLGDITPHDHISKEMKHEWELKGEVNKVVFPTGTILIDDTLYIYYGAADERIACASLSLTALLAEVLIHPM